MDCDTDQGYKEDLRLVNVAYGNEQSMNCDVRCSALVAKNPGGTAAEYWLASRNKFSGSIEGWGRYISTDGSVGISRLFKESGLDERSSGAIRPVVTLKSTVKISSGDGSVESSYILS